ncbi:hypothetical protein TWF106_011318 [Orbilia oligospora]|uniref:PNK3P-domain-containing protein n=1 Tax=Orbilia oligospora TaxID=2813651 RepID=A0A7C8QEL6_ORBOL|nr:hypothetical protein TWF106_011318 [Orbilia oligospora]
MWLVSSWFRVVDIVIAHQRLPKRVGTRLAYKPSWHQFSYLQLQYRTLSQQTSGKMPPKGKRKAREETPEKNDGAVSPPPVKRPNAGTSSAAATSFFTPTSQKSSPIEFIKHGSLLAALWEPVASSSKAVTTPLSDGRIKFAGFDLDSNLISTKSGKTFARDGEDWKWWHPTVPSKLRKMFEEGYRLVIFTNQNGLKASGSKADDKLKEWKKKINYIVTALNLPIHVYAATETDSYRKPRTGMFEHYLSELGADAPLIDMDSSVFVGDAAGRKGDFSAGDRKFAENLGLKFLTPEELFLNEEPRPYELDLDPASLPRSTVAPDKCIKAAQGFLKEGESVVIDATNSSRDTRAVWKGVADKAKGATFRCIYLTTSEALCYHNDGARAYSGMKSLNPENRTSVGSMAFRTFKSKFQEPHVNEGFKDITVVDFEFRGTDAEFDVWKRHWAP